MRRGALQRDSRAGLVQVIDSAHVAGLSKDVALCALTTEGQAVAQLLLTAEEAQ